MKELKRRVALLRALMAASSWGRREVALYRGYGDDPPVVTGRIRGFGPIGVRVGPVRLSWPELRMVETHPPTRCPNCMRRHGPLDECLLGVLGGIVAEREGRMVTAEQLAAVDVDELWDLYGGPAADWLEDWLDREAARGGI